MPLCEEMHLNIKSQAMYVAVCSFIISLFHALFVCAFLSFVVLVFLFCFLYKQMCQGATDAMPAGAYARPQRGGGRWGGKWGPRVLVSWHFLHKCVRGKIYVCVGRIMCVVVWGDTWETQVCIESPGFWCDKCAHVCVCVCVCWGRYSCVEIKVFGRDTCETPVCIYTHVCGPRQNFGVVFGAFCGKSTPVPKGFLG